MVVVNIFHLVVCVSVERVPGGHSVLDCGFTQSFSGCHSVSERFMYCG